MTRLSLCRPFGVSYVSFISFPFSVLSCSVSAVCGWNCAAMCVRPLCRSAWMLAGWFVINSMHGVHHFLHPDSQRYRVDTKPLMRPSGLDSLVEGEASLLYERRCYRDKGRDTKQIIMQTIALSLYNTACPTNHQRAEEESGCINVFSRGRIRLFLKDKQCYSLCFQEKTKNNTWFIPLWHCALCRCTTIKHIH